VQQATELHEASRETVRKFINAGSINEIVFTRGTTESINLLAYRNNFQIDAFPFSQQLPGDNVTMMFHYGNNHFINAGSINEIVFTRGTTESINLLASSFGEAFLHPGDEVIVSSPHYPNRPMVCRTLHGIVSENRLLSVEYHTCCLGC